MLLPSARTDPHVVFDGPEGTITLVPACVDEATARAWFHALRQATPWQASRRRMYARDVDVPRLTAHYAIDDARLPEPLHDALLAVRRFSDVDYNTVGLNLYRDGNDSVAPHNDKLHEIEAGFPIALLSLGATRRMTIRTKQVPRRALQLDLEAGSLLLMSYATQLHFDHGIAKTTQKVAPRISLAFRRRPQRSLRERYG